MIMMAMQTCQEYAAKSANTPLTEYEMLMYEQACRMLASYFKGHDLSLRKQMPEIERETIRAEAEHREWLDANDEGEEEAAA